MTSAKRRRRFHFTRRVLIVLLVLSVLFLVSFTLLFAPSFIPTEWATAVIIGAVEKQLHWKVEIGNASFTHWGKMKLEDVAVRDPDNPSAPPIMTAKWFELNIRLLPLLRKRFIIKRLILREPAFAVDAETLSQIKIEKPKPSEKPEGFMAYFAIEKLVVERGSLRVSNEGGKELFSAEDFSFFARGALYEPLTYTLSFKLKTPKFDADAESEGVLTAFRGAGFSLIVDKLNCVSSSFSASLTGSVKAEGDKPRISMQLVAQGELEPLVDMISDYLRPLPTDLDIRGTSKLKATVTGTPDSITLSGRVDFPEVPISYAGKPALRLMGPDDVMFEFTYQPAAGQIVIKKVAARSSLGFSVWSGVVYSWRKAPKYDIKVRSSVEMDELTRVLRLGKGLMPAPLQFDGFVHSETTIQGEGNTFGIDSTLDLTYLGARYGKLSIKDRGEPVRLHLNANCLESEIVIAKGTYFATEFADLPIQGKISFRGEQPEFTFSFSPEVDVSKWLARARESGMEIPASLQLDGVCRGNLTTHGTAKRLDVAGSFDLTDMGFGWKRIQIKERGVPTVFDIEMYVSESEIALEQLMLEGTLGRVAVSGKLREIQTEPKVDFVVTSRINLAEALRLAKNWDIVPPAGVRASGVLAVNTSIKGPLGAIELDAMVDARETELSYRDASIKRRGESPEIALTALLKGRDITIRKMLYRTKVDELTCNGKIRDYLRRPSASLSIAAKLDATRRMSLLRSALRQILDEVNPKQFEPEIAQLVSSLPEDINAKGSLSARTRLQLDSGGVQLDGAVSLSELGITYRDIPIKKRGSRVDMRFDFACDGENFDFAKLQTVSRAGTTTFSGRISPFGETVSYDVKTLVQCDLERLWSSLPLDELGADELINEILLKRGINATELKRQIRLDGTAVVSVNARGDLARCQLTGYGDFTDTCLDYLAERNFSKPLGKRCRAEFACVVSRNDFRLSRLDAIYGEQRVLLDGELICTRNNLRADRLRVRWNDREALASFDILGYATNQIGINSLRIEAGGSNFAARGIVARDKQSVALRDFVISVNEDSFDVSMNLRNYNTDAPELALVVSGNRLDLRKIPGPLKIGPAAVKKREQSEEKKSGDEPSEKAMNFMRRTRADVKVFVGTVLFDIDDRLDRNPGMRHYQLKNFALKAKLSEGILDSGVTLVMNEGIMKIRWLADFNGDLVDNKVQFWADGLEANDNLRPPLNAIFTNLYVTGDMGFNGEFRWEGFSQRNMDRTFVGESELWVNRGYLLGKAAPDYIVKLFPGLQLARFKFDHAQLVSKTKGPISENEMKFHAGTLATYMIGKTNNKTHEIDYTFGVELIESLAMGQMRDRIPDFIEKNARVDIVRYRGDIYNQKAEWFEPKAEAVVATLKWLVQWQTMRTLFSFDKSAIEKRRLLQKRLKGIIGVPLSLGEKALSLPGALIDNSSK